MRIKFLLAVLCANASLAWCAPAHPIPFKQDSAASTPWSGAGLALIMVSVLAIVAVVVVRKRLRLTSPPGGARMLRVLETERLGPRNTLSVVEFKGEHYLLSQGDHGVTCLVAPPRGATS